MSRSLISQDTRFAGQIISICLIWYTCSSGQNVVNKIALQQFPYPLTIALSSLLNNVIYAIPLSKYLHIKPVRASQSYLCKMILPISAGRALAVGFAYFGLLKVPVSYAQTVKATMPVFTVLISRVMLHERQSNRVYISLIPVIFGVFVASVTEIQFDLSGLLCSLFSTSLFAGLNVLAKKVFQDTGMHPINLLSLNSQLAAVMLFPLWVLKDGSGLWTAFTSYDQKEDSTVHIQTFVYYLFFSGLLSFIQNLCAFTLIHQLTTLSYAVSNAAKRIAVIVISLLWLKNPVTPINMAGMLISVLGVLLYNRAKHSERLKRSKSPLITEEEHRDNGHLFRRHDRHLHLTGMTSSNSDVKLMLSTN